MKDLDFYEFLEGIKKVTRFRPFNGLHENVAGHCFNAIMLAFDLMEKYDLNLDKQEVLRILMVHDLVEIGMDYDITAPESAGSKDIKEKKKQLELDAVKNISKNFGRKYIEENFIKFEGKETREALFANLVDKVETSIHILTNKCADFACDEDFEFILHYTDKYAQHFPELNDLILDIKNGLQEVYQEFKNKK